MTCGLRGSFALGGVQNPLDVREHKCYMYYMDTTIRNIDKDIYRRIKAQAAMVGRTVGDVLNDAMRLYLAQPEVREKRGSLRDLRPERYPEGTEGLSDQIDKIVYGVRGE